MATETKWERQLMLSELRYRKLFETAKDGILLIDPATEKIIDANPFLLELIKYSKPEILGKELWEIGAVQDITYAKKMFEELQAKGYVRYEDLPIKSKDGEEHEVEFVSNRYPIGDTEMIQCNIRDITERKMAEKKAAAYLEDLEHERTKLAIAIKKEKELDREKDEFISIASHQLRAPLTGIQWVVERFAKRETLTPKGKEYLDDIHTSARQLNKLVDALLNLSRIQEGHMSITPEPLEVVAFIKSFLSEIGPLQDKKALKIVFEDHPAEIPVKTDKSALRNIIQGVISNAIEYTPSGGTVTIGAKKDDAMVTISVQDTGIGIPENAKEHIFEKFVRAENAKLYKADGTGIGLYIASQAAIRLGGKIWFASEENKGSAFYIALPLESKPQS